MMTDIGNKFIPALDGPRAPLAGKTGLDAAAAVRRHWRMVTALTLAGGLGAYLLCHSFTPLYDSTVTVMIQPPEASNSGDRPVTLPFMAPSEESIRKNQMAILTSRDLAYEVTSKLALDGVAEFNPALSPPSRLTWLTVNANAAVAWLRDMLGVPPKNAVDPQNLREVIVDRFLARLLAKEGEASRVIQIRFRSEDPARAAQIAMTVGERYIMRTQEQLLAERQDEGQSLEGQIQAANEKLRDAELDIERIRNQKGEFPAANLKILQEQLSELSRQLVFAMGETAAAEGRLAELRLARSSKGTASSGTVLKSPLIQRLQEQATELLVKIDELRGITLPGYSSRIAAAENALKDVQRALERETEKIASSVDSDLQGALTKETKLRSAIALTKAEIAKAASSDVDARMLERKIEANRLLMKQLVAMRISTLTPMSRDRVAASMLSPATIARYPSYPPTLAVVAVALVIFATGGAAFAIMLERRDRSIWSTTQLRQLTSAPVLGALPRLGRRVDYLKRSPAAHVLTHRRSMFTESLRMVWLHIDRPREERIKTVLVTSSLPDEGKSSIAVALARMLATSGRRTLLVDADLRYPTVHRALELPFFPGLVDVLTKKVTLVDAIQKDKPSGAFVLTAGSADASPADLLQSDQMPALIGEMVAQYDAIIIDAPPVLAVPDAGILGGLVDRTALVVRWGATKMETVAEALQRLQDGGARPAMILSMVDPKAHSGHGDSAPDIFSDALRRYYS